MTKKKSTKRALLMSALALLMCVSMLVGSTFAWFTDSVTSAGNIIKSGTLEVTMEWKDATAAGAQQSYKDASEGAIFNYDKWEPGYVEAKNIKIKNIGTLALRYQLNILANGEVSKLADVIDVYYADGEVALTDRDMAGLGYLGTLSKVLKEINTTASGNLLAGAGHTVTLALKMQETAGNDYQDLAIGSDFAVQLLATQLTAEEDSFDEMYDKNAAWDGTIPATKPDTLVVDTDAKLISINDPAAFAYLNTLINDPNFTATYGSKWKYSIELNTDVNLLGQAWTPIFMSNFVAFDGKGHTISNLYVVGEDSVGLFSEIRCNDIGATIVKDLTIDGAYVKGKKSVGVLAGMNPQGNIEKVTINNATVIGSKYVGGVFGHGNCYVKDSTVKNSTITIPENGEKEAGGLIGYLSNDGLSSTVDKVISGNHVENVTVTAPTIASGLVSQPNSSNVGGAVIVIKDNTMKNVTIATTKDATAEYYVSNNVGGKSKVENNSAEDCVLSVAVSTADDLKAAVEAGKNVVLAADIVVDTADTGFTVNNGVSAKLDLNGHDIIGTSTSSAGVQLFSVNGNLDITGEGTISLTNPNFAWSTSYRHTAINVRESGVVTLGEDVKVVCTAGENTAGGYGMAYAVDIYTTGTLKVNGASLHSNYVAVRCFYGNSVVNVGAGSTITSSKNNYGIWLQSSPGAVITIDSTVSHTIDDDIYYFS